MPAFALEALFKKPLTGDPQSGSNFGLCLGGKKTWGNLHLSESPRERQPLRTVGTCEVSTMPVEPSRRRDTEGGLLSFGSRGSR